MRYLLILLLANSVYAADSCCVDEDMGAAFLSYMTLSRDWPADFPVSIEIEGFEFIGSSHYQGSEAQSVAWKSELSPQATRDLLARAVLADGWTAMPGHAHSIAGRERGFVPHREKQTSDNQQFCRGRDGSLSVQARDTAIGTVVSLGYQSESRGRDCAGLIAERNAQHVYEGGIMSHLPVLMLPEYIDTYQPSGTGGGGDRAEASMSVTTDASPAELSLYFEPQMREQQWKLESDIRGGKISGHVWRRTVDGQELICTVTAVETGRGLRLRMYLESV